MATVALSGIITPTNVVTATSTTTLTNKTLTGAVMNGTLGATTPSTVVATTVQASTTMGVGGATPSTSGAGITFPATASASTSANTLDDYEEGTFTPTLGADSGSATYSSRNGIYVKVGKMVTVNFYVVGSAVGTLSGPVNVSLPFAAFSTESYSPSPSIRTASLVSVTGVIGGIVGSGSSALSIQIYNNGGVSNLTASNLPSSSFQIGGTLSYITD